MDENDYELLARLAWSELHWRGYAPEEFSHKEGVKLLPQVTAQRGIVFGATFDEEAFKIAWDARRDAARAR
jgi:hypothetical protein